MGVAEVAGYGQITQSNAKEIYAAWKKGDIELTPSQQTYAESFLTPEEMDEISYETSYEEGHDKINTEGTETKQTASVAVGAANIGGCASLITLLYVLDGFSQLGLAIAVAAAGAFSLALSYAYDSEYKNRTAANDEAENTNATIDGYSTSLNDTMDMMNTDSAEYQARQNEYTMAANANASQIASLKIELASAQAAGDTNAIKNLNEQIKGLEKADMSGYEDSLEETAGRLGEYAAANQESMGVRDAGQSVSNFLKQGTTLGVLGHIQAFLFGALSVMAAGAVLGMFPKLAPFFPDAPTSIAAKILTAAGSITFGLAAKNMSTKSSTEIECGRKGNDMQENHLSGLDKMIGEQSDYIDQTGADYKASDADAQKSKDEAQETADKAVEENSPNPNPEPGEGEGEGGQNPQGAVA